MAESGETKALTSEEKQENNAKLDEQESENLSTKLGNIAVVNSSLQTVSKTCNTIKESNSYVGYGMTVAESSLDKAFKAGKAVLDSRTLAPITNTALENIRYLDKEAGVMVDKFLKSNDGEENEKQENGVVQEISENATADQSISGLVLNNESMFYFLGRKFFEVTSFLIFLPYFGPKYALATIWNLFQGGEIGTRRKRKERGSMSEEVKYMEPSPVKRKYGDRQSTSSEEGTTLVEILQDYVSEEDSDYVPSERDAEESSEESEHELDEEEKRETLKECLDLTQELEKMGIPLSPEIQSDIVKLKGEENKAEPSPSKTRSTPRKTTGESLPPQAQSEKGSENQESSSTKEIIIQATKVVADEKNTKVPTESEKIMDTKIKGNENLQEIPLKESSSGGKETKEASKNAKENKSSKIDPLSKTRRSSKSPLLEKLLSPGRRSRKGQKEKSKSGGGESSESAVFAEGGSSKSDDNAKTEMTNMAENSSKVEDGSKGVLKSEGKEKDSTKARTQSENVQKASEELQKSKKKSEYEKREISKSETKASETPRHETEALTTVTGPFDVFKFGGKKSK